MRLLKIETDNVLGLADGSYAFTKRAHDALAGATVITGPSGAGKTSLLTAIAFGREALAGYGPPEKPERLLRFGASKGSLRIAFELDETEVALAEVEERTVELTISLAADAAPPTVSKSLRKLFGRFGDKAALGALEYFPDNRTLDPVGARTALEQEKRLRPGRARQKYSGLVPWLQSLAAKSAAEPNALASFRAALEQLAPGLELIGLDAQEVPELLFALGGSSMPIGRLSTSQAQAVLIAGTLVRFGLETGLVLIDQPELHLGSEAQARFVRGLALVARDAQLIIATGSSSVVAAVQSSQLLQLKPPAASALTAAAPLPYGLPSLSLNGARPAEPPPPEKPSTGPSALETPRPIEAPTPSQDSTVARPAAVFTPREASHATPSYLQQQARTPAPYLPIADAPAPYLPIADAPAPYVPMAEAQPATPIAHAPPRVVIRPYEPPAQAPAPQPPPASVPATEEIDTSAFRNRKPLSAEDASVLARMKQGTSGASADSTAFLNPVAPPSANQLPFRPSAPASASAPAAPASSRHPSLQSGFTMAGSSGARPSMPFMRGGSPNPESLPPGWSIQRYAALCIDLHASGMPEERVLAMAQLSRDQRLALDNYWQGRMTQEPALRAEWKAHADRREAELRGRR
jgi:hypothetical protein